MILGIGTDILWIDRIRTEVESPDGAFLRAVYTPAERREAALRPEALRYYATRFAGKEAVYKALGRMEGEVRLSEIEILTDPFGAPEVRLTGACLRRAETMGVREVQLSLSYEKDYAIAFALAQQ